MVSPLPRPLDGSYLEFSFYFTDRSESEAFMDVAATLVAEGGLAYEASADTGETETIKLANSSLSELRQRRDVNAISFVGATGVAPGVEEILVRSWISDQARALGDTAPIAIWASADAIDPPTSEVEEARVYELARRRLQSIGPPCTLRIPCSAQATSQTPCETRFVCFQCSLSTSTSPRRSSESQRCKRSVVSTRLSR